MVFIEKQWIISIFRLGWQNSPGGGKIAPVYGTAQPIYLYLVILLILNYVKKSDHHSVITKSFFCRTELCWHFQLQMDEEMYRVLIVHPRKNPKKPRRFSSISRQAQDVESMLT